MEILRSEWAVSSQEQLRLDHSPQKLLQGHAVVVEEAGQGHWSGGQDAHPAGRLPADERAQAEIESGGQPHGGHGTNKLPGGQAEENRLLVLADLFRNFDLDNKSPHIHAKI